jgi:hypothetical protein
MRNRSLPIALALLAGLLAAPAVGEEAGRYVLKDVEGGYLRLDTRTGALSHCRPRERQWLCESVADDRKVLQDEIAALESENAKLKERIAELESQPRLKLPSQQDLDRAMSLFERLMKRLMDFARNLDPAPGRHT